MNCSLANLQYLGTVMLYSGTSYSHRSFKGLHTLLHFTIPCCQHKTDHAHYNDKKITFERRILTDPTHLGHKQKLASWWWFCKLLGIISCEISGHTHPWAIRSDTISVCICRSLTHLRSFWEHWRFCWCWEHFAGSLYPFLSKHRKRSQSFNSSKLFFLFVSCVTHFYP